MCGGSVGVEKFGLLPVIISWLAENAAEVCGISATTYSLVIAGMSGLVVPEPPSQIVDMKTWISARLSISGSSRNSISDRISTSGISAELRPPVCVTWGPWKGSVLYAAYLARTCHYGCRISFPSRPHRSGLTWQLGCCDLRYLRCARPQDTRPSFTRVHKWPANVRCRCIRTTRPPNGKPWQFHRACHGPIRSSETKHSASQLLEREIDCHPTSDICCQNSQWLEPAPCCCCWAGESSCLQSSAGQICACSNAITHHHH